MGEDKPACRQAGMGVDKLSFIPLPFLPSRQGRGRQS